MLLPILIDFVKALHPNDNVGISKGLRSSQFFGNLYHNDIDHAMIEECGKTTTTAFVTTYTYLETTRKSCGNTKDTLHRLCKPYNLIIKPRRKLHPSVQEWTHSALLIWGLLPAEKAYQGERCTETRQDKVAQRRQQIIGSFKGMACHADCKHLYYTLTGKHMKKFSEMGVTYTPADGKKRFPAR